VPPIFVISGRRQRRHERLLTELASSYAATYRPTKSITSRKDSKPEDWPLRMWDIPQRLRKYSNLVSESGCFIEFYGLAIPSCVAGKAIAQQELDLKHSKGRG